MRPTAPPKLQWTRGIGRDDECALLAICTAQGYDYLEVSDAFEREHGASMSECVRRRIKYRDFIAYLKRINGRSVRWAYESRPIPPYALLWEHTPNLRGVGILAIKERIIGYRHAVAYENGWIYDGNQPRPMSYDMWALCLDGEWIIDGMQRSFGKEEKCE